VVMLRRDRGQVISRTVAEPHLPLRILRQDPLVLVEPGIVRFTGRLLLGYTCHLYNSCSGGCTEAGNVLSRVLLLAFLMVRVYHICEMMQWLFFNCVKLFTCYTCFK